MPAKTLSISRLAFGLGVMLSVVALAGCAFPESQAEQNAKTAAAVKAGAEGGNPFMQFVYAMYLKGDKDDYVAALPWFQKSAQSGNPGAQEELSRYYYYGRAGLPKNPTLAASWMQKAAEQGQATAQFYLATMYGEGYGVRKDKARQIEWLEKSARQFNRPAYEQLVSLGDPHGVAQQVEAQRQANFAEMNARTRAEMNREAVQRANAQVQPMCQIRSGPQAGAMIPC